MTKIAKCPNCKHDPLRYNTGDAAKFQIVCLNCDMRGPTKSTFEAAIAAWNQVAGMRELAEYISQGRVFEDVTGEEATHEDMGRHVWPDRYATLLKKANQALKGGD